MCRGSMCDTYMYVVDLYGRFAYHVATNLS